MKNSFGDLGIIPPILEAIEEIGYEEPTEVQAKAIPHILNKEDIIVISKTGSGKTAVFGVSMLQLIDHEAEGPQGLILTPTRELAVQVDNDIKQLAKHMKHKTAAVYGQHNINTEVMSLEKGVSIVTGTPGRVFDHISQGTLNTKNIQFLVLDEADRMLDMGFFDQVVRIIKQLPTDRITLLFSATIPQEILIICSEYMKDPVTVEIESATKTVDTIKQIYYRVEYNEKNTQLNRLLLVEQPESCMVFCNTKMAVDRVQRFLTRKGYASLALHGDIPQAKRMKTIQQFKKGSNHILVATDVAARGIHVDDLALVINYDIPQDKDSYIHRIGRTGRAGNEGYAINFVTGNDIMSLYEIEEHIGAMIEERELPSDELYRERKAAAAEWLKANALPEGATIESPYKDRASQKNYTKGRRQSAGSRPGPGDSNTVDWAKHTAYKGKRDNRENNSHKDYKDRKDGRGNRTNKRPDSYDDKQTGSGTSKNTKLASSAAKPAKQALRTVKASTGKTNDIHTASVIAKEKTDTAVAAKSSFLKKIFRGFFGEKE